MTVRIVVLVQGAESSAELSLTVPIVNTLAFLFTVLGDWWVEKKVISRGMSSCTLAVGLSGLVELIGLQKPGLG